MAEFDTGMGTTPGMWQLVSEELAEAGAMLPESVNAAIYALCEGTAKVVREPITGE